MRNLKLTENMQTKVRDFMLKTISNMDSQKELEAFLKILSPSVKKSVTNHIFTEVILQNPIFCDKMDVIIEFIDHFQLKLFFPEDPVLKMGSKCRLIYLIANGDCEVSI